jgi:hypothetical protein
LAPTSWDINSQPADVAIVVTRAERVPDGSRVTFHLALHPRSPSSIFVTWRGDHYFHNGPYDSDDTSGEEDIYGERQPRSWLRRENELRPGAKCEGPVCDGEVVLFGLFSQKKKGSFRITNDLIHVPSTRLTLDVGTKE